VQEKIFDFCQDTCLTELNVSRRLPRKGETGEVILLWAILDGEK
jgi:hypothetical protein